MKVALVLTGHMRCWEKCFPNTKERIIDKYNPDIYIATWDNEGYWTSPENDPEGHGINKQSPKLDISKIYDTYRPKTISVYEQNLYAPKFEKTAEQLQPYCKEIRSKNIVSQFFMIEQGLKHLTLLYPHLKYDMVIRMRPDLIFHEELPDFNPNIFNAIKHPNHEGDGIGDMFTATNCSTAFLIMDALKYDYHKIAINSKRFCPHLLMHTLANTSIDAFHSFNSGEIVGSKKLIIHDIPKTIQHTPNGQYQDYKP